MRRWRAHALLSLLTSLAGAGLGGTLERPSGGADASLAALLVGGAFDYNAQSGDSLTSVSARFGVDVAALARANGLALNARLALGQALHIANPHIVPAITASDEIVVNIPQRMLFQVAGGEVVRGYPIAAGRPSWRTPRGEFAIDERATDKPWIVPVSIQEEMRREGKPVKTLVPPGPDNPLGRHWLGLAGTSCGIHGTIAPASIYGLRTHGCIRLHPDDIAEVFERSGLGETARLVYEPVLLAALPDGRVCLEAHRDAYGLAPPAEEALAGLIAANGAAERIDLARAREVLAAHEGIASDVTRGSAGGPCS
jgi:L,D-transpeptidase ErfK/SrfK